MTELFCQKYSAGVDEILREYVCAIYVYITFFQKFHLLSRTKSTAQLCISILPPKLQLVIVITNS